MFNRGQLVNDGIYQKSVYKIEFYKSENYVEKFSASCVVKRKHLFWVSIRFVAFVLKQWSLVPNILSSPIAMIFKH